MSKTGVWCLVGALVGGLLFLTFLGQFKSSCSVNTPPSSPTTWTGKRAGVPKVGGSFALINHKGQRQTDLDFRGRFMIVYFGYAYCPQICPMALSHISEALQMLDAKKVQEFQPIFISLDPERDTPQTLRTFLSNYHVSFIALTGSKEETTRVAKAYRVYWRKNQDSSSQTDYEVDHSSIVYVMDRQGRLKTSFNHTTPPQTIHSVLMGLL